MAKNDRSFYLGLGYFVVVLFYAHLRIDPWLASGDQSLPTPSREVLDVCFALAWPAILLWDVTGWVAHGLSGVI